MARAAETSDETVQTVYALLEKIGKRPIVMKIPLPGFISNRLQMAMLPRRSTSSPIGAATPEDVDTAVQNAFGRRYAIAGPLAVFDMSGLNTLQNVLQQTVASSRHHRRAAGLHPEEGR